MSFGPKLDELMIALQDTLEAVKTNSGGDVFLDTRQLETPPLGTGIMYAVQFKVKGRPVYSAHLFHFWVNVWNDQLLIDWKGRRSFADSNDLKIFVKSILNESVVKESINQLRVLAEGVKEGVIKTIDPNTIGSLDFLVEIGSEEFQKIENAYNNQCSVDIRATESQQRQLPNGYHPELASRYKFLDTQGMIMDIDSIEKKGEVLYIRISDVR